MAEPTGVRGRNQPASVPYPAKLTLPARRPAIIHRQRLIDLLSEHVSRRITIVTAPAGYGKTTLLLDFAQSWDRSEEHTSELHSPLHLLFPLFFFNEPAPTDLSPLPLPAPLPISPPYHYRHRPRGLREDDAPPRFRSELGRPRLLVRAGRARPGAADVPHVLGGLRQRAVPIVRAGPRGSAVRGRGRKPGALGRSHGDSRSGRRPAVRPGLRRLPLSGRDAAGAAAGP